MNSIFTRSCLCLVLSLFVSFASAEVYTWVDENGKKHYGDSVPAKYQTQSKTVDTNDINTIQSVDPQHYAEPDYGAAQNDGSDARSKLIKSNEPASRQNDSCEQQLEAFKRSQACYGQCGLVGGGINKARCSHCVDLKKPNC